MPTPTKRERLATNGGHPSMLNVVNANSSDTASSLPPPPAVSSADLKRILADLRHECAAATVRQEEFFKQVFTKHKDLQEELMVVRSTAVSQASAQEHMLAEIRHISSLLTKGVTADKNIISQIAHAGHALAKGIGVESESHPQIAANGNSGFCKILDNAGHKTPDEASTNEEAQFNPCSSINTPSTTPTRGTSNSSNRKTKLAFDFDKEDHSDKSISARVRRLLRRKEFEFAIAFALICNCFVMCWECQYQGLEVGFKLQYPGRSQQADMVWSGAETAFFVLDWLFGMLFLFECLVKLACWRQSYFCDYWNILDLGCVFAFLFGKALGAGGAFKPHMLRLLRLFRLARLVRLIRFLEHLEALYVMTTAIAGMKKVLGWAIFLLTIMLLTCDLALVQLLQVTYFSEASASVLTEDQLETHHKMYAYFGTCTRCMLSMFEITLGNWPPIARLLAEEVSEWFILLCLIHKLTIGFAVVGVITGVILQETFKVAQTDDIIMLRQKKRASDVLRAKLTRLFDSLDKNEDDVITYREFERICTDFNIKIWLQSLDIETNDLPMLFHLVDSDHDGHIVMDEMLDNMPRIRGAARSIDVLSLHEKFKNGNV